MILNRATYNKLITPDGQPQYGRFQQPFAEINYRDFDYRNQMDKPAGRLQKHFHFNQFHFIGLHSQHYTLACAIADVRYVANAFVYLFDHASGQLHQHSYIQPLGLRCRHSTQPFSGLTRMNQGNAHFEILARNRPNRYQLNIDIGKDIHIDAQVTEPEGFEPTVVCTRAGYNGWAFTQKHCTMEVSGYIQWKGLDIPLETEQFTASSDWSCGFMERETAWNWSSISCILPDATRLGLNLACGVNETSFNENTLWTNGKAHALPAAYFEFDRKNRMAPWQVTTVDHSVELTFVPEACHREKVNAYLVASNFSQLPGKYYGTLRDTDGNQYRLEGVNGLIEDHYAKW